MIWIGSVNDIIVCEFELAKCQNTPSGRSFYLLTHKKREGEGEEPLQNLNKLIMVANLFLYNKKTYHLEMWHIQWEAISTCSYIFSLQQRITQTTHNNQPLTAHPRPNKKMKRQHGIVWFLSTNAYHIRYDDANLPLLYLSSSPPPPPPSILPLMNGISNIFTLGQS